MKIKITAGGIYGASGEIAIGTEFEVKAAPKGWAGRYEVVTADAPKDAVAITNPARDDDAAQDKPRRGRPPKSEG